MFIVKFLGIIVFLSLTLFANGNLEKVSLQLNWKYQFEFAGFIAAKEKGFYKDIGYDLEIKEYNENIDVIKEVKEKRATFGIYDLSLFEYFDKQKPLYLLANYLKRPALVFVAKQDILTPFDFKDKTIMVENNIFEKSNLGDLLNLFDIKKKDFKKIVPHNFKADDFISGKIDIMTIYLSNELYDIKKSKIPFNIIDPSNYGLNSFSLNLFTLKEDFLDNREKISDFIKATKKGWEYAFSHKEEIVEIIYEKYSNFKSKEALLFEANEIEKLMLTNLYEIGSIDNEMIHNIIQKLDVENLTLDVDEVIFKPKKELHLNIDELLYLENKKIIKMCIDPDWLPFEKFENGTHIGMTKDFMDYFAYKLRTPIEVINTKTWGESLDSFKSNKCDILSLVTPTLNRIKYMNITKPYINAPLVIVTKNDKLFIDSLNSLERGDKLGVVSGYATYDILKSKYNDRDIVQVASVNEGLQKVLNGEILGFIDTIPTVAFEIQNNFFGKLKIAGKLDDELVMGIGVNRNDETLFEIFNKLIATLSEKEKQEIVNKWVNIKIEQKVDYVLIWEVVLFFFVVLIIVLYRHKELLKKNGKIEEQRVELEKNNNNLKETQKKLEQTLLNFETLLDSSIDSIFIFEDNMCIDVNKNGKNLLGINSKVSVVGKNIFEIFDFDKDLLNNSYEPFEVVIKFENKDLIPCLIKINSTSFEGKSVNIVSAVDLTDVKEKELLLLKQSKMAAMGEMIGNIAHQWRQPLSVISAVSTGLMLKISMGKVDSVEFTKSLDSLNKSVQYLSQTIEDFRNFYKTDKEKHYTTIKRIIDKNLNLMGTTFSANHIDIILNDRSDNKEISVYENELLQAVVNIVNNAKDAFDNIDIEKKYIFIDLIENEKGSYIIIKDNAGGIPKNIIDKIFEPYFTTKHKSNGTGIGLYMTHEIIVKHINGELRVKNEDYTYDGEQYRGASFTIFIPSF